MGFGEDKEKKVDPVGGREIIELDEGKAYIITSGDWRYQIELTIGKNGYPYRAGGIAASGAVI